MPRNTSLIRIYRCGAHRSSIASSRLASSSDAMRRLVALRVHPRQRLRIGVAGEDAVADRDAELELDARNARGRLVGDDLEVVGVAADHGAERDQRVVIAALREALQRERRLERARHGDDGDPFVGDTALPSSARNAPASRPSPIRGLKRDWTIATRRAAPSRLGSIRRIGIVSGDAGAPRPATLAMSVASAGARAVTMLRARRRFVVARHFEVESRHARHLALPREQSHPADVQVAQDLRADAVVAQVHLRPRRATRRRSRAGAAPARFRRDAGAR